MYNPLDVDLIECRWYSSTLMLCFYVGCYLVALGVIGFLPLAIMWRLLIITIMSVYAMWTGLRSVLFLLPSSFLAVRRSVTAWFVYNEQKGWQAIELLPKNCIVLAWIIVLTFRIEGIKKSFTVCLPIDGMSKNEHRRLRVYLRYLT